MMSTEGSEESGHGLYKRRIGEKHEKSQSSLLVS